MSLDVELRNGDAVWFQANITHNLNKMADAVGLYKPLWRPDELGYTKAKDLSNSLLEGLYELLKRRDEVMWQYAPKNGWGCYADLLEFTFDYLRACQTYPDAEVHVCR